MSSDSQVRHSGRRPLPADLFWPSRYGDAARGVLWTVRAVVLFLTFAIGLSAPALAAPGFEITGGDDQRAPVQQPLPNPLQVTITGSGPTDQTITPTGSFTRDVVTRVTSSQGSVVWQSSDSQDGIGTPTTTFGPLAISAPAVRQTGLTCSANSGLRQVTATMSWTTTTTITTQNQEFDSETDTWVDVGPPSTTTSSDSGSDALQFRETCDPVPCPPITLQSIPTQTTDWNQQIAIPNLLAGATPTDVGMTATFPTRTALGGTLSGSFDNLTYTPPADIKVTGQTTSINDSFDYTAAYICQADNTQKTAQGTVNITVNLGAPPVANTDRATTPLNTPTVISVLANDSGTDITLVASSVPGASSQGGTLTVAGNQVTYTPRANFASPPDDSFTYRIVDRFGREAGPATVNLTVSNTDPPPVANPIAVSTGVNKPVQINVREFDQGAEITVVPGSVTTSAQGVTPVVGADGYTILYTPPPGFVGTDTFEYRIMDRTGRESGPATITVTIEDGRPVAAPVSQSVPFGQATRIVIPGAAAAGVTLALTTGPRNGKAVNNGDGSVTYTPNPLFSGVDSFQYQLSNSAGSSESTVTVTVGAAPNLSDVPGLTGNELAVARALDSACAAEATGAQLQSRCAELFALSPSEQRVAIGQITPEQKAAETSQYLRIQTNRLASVQQRLVALRQGARGVAANFNINGQAVPVSKLAQALQRQNGGAAGDVPTGAHDGTLDEDPFRDTPFGVFIQGRYNGGTRSNTANERGYSFNSGGFTAGLDYRFSDQLVMGLAFGYDGTASTFASQGGNMSTSSAQGAVYGSYYLPHDFYVDWMANYTGHGYSVQRNMAYPGFATAARSNPEGAQYGFALNLGRDFAVEEWNLNPYLRMEYQKLQIGAYNERGGEGLAMGFGGQTVTGLTTDLGGQVGRAFSMDWGVLTPMLRFEWEHQFDYSTQFINGQFLQAAPGTGLFTISSTAPSRNYFNLGGSVAATFAEGKAAFLRYETRLGQAGIASHVVEAGIRIPF